MENEEKSIISNENIIEIDHLTKDYGFSRGVFDVSFHVKKGEVFWLFRTKRSRKVHYNQTSNGLF